MRSRTHKRPAGVGLIYVTVTLTVMIAFIALAVDAGRVQLAKAELQTAADAAARYAATGIADNTYLSKAQAAASANTCDGTPVTLQGPDVVVGTWSGETFAPGGSAPNALQVTTLRRITLLFGSVIGIAPFEARATAISTITASRRKYAFVGLDSINASGNAEVDSYEAAKGAYSAGSRRSNGDIATNGRINLNGNVKIHGDIHHRTGYTHNGNAGVVPPGRVQVLSEPLSYPPPTLPDSYLNKGNFNGSGNGSLTLTSGNYYYTKFSTSGNFRLTISGQVNLYVNGNVNLSGNFDVLNNLPGNFRVYMLSSAGVNISGNAGFYADIYAPSSPVNISGNGDFYGRILGKSISASGNGMFHYDESIDGNQRGGRVLLVH